MVPSRLRAIAYRHVMVTVIWYDSYETFELTSKTKMPSIQELLKEELEDSHVQLRLLLRMQQTKSLAEIYASHAEWPVSYLEIASKLQIAPVELLASAPMPDILTEPQAPEARPASQAPGAPLESPPEATKSLNDLLMNLPTDLQMHIFQLAGAWVVPSQYRTVASWSVCRKWKRLIWSADCFIDVLAKIIVGFEERRAGTSGKRAVDSALLRLTQAGRYRDFFLPRMVGGFLHLLIKAVLHLPGARADVEHGLALCNAIDCLREDHRIEVAKVLLTAKNHPARASSSGSIRGLGGRHITGKPELISILKLSNRGAQPGYALVLAAEKGYVEILELLLDWPVHAPRADCFCGQAIMGVAMGGHLEALQLLVAKWPKPYRRRHNRAHRLKKWVLLQSAVKAAEKGPAAHNVLMWLLNQSEANPDMPKANARDGLLLVTAATAGHVATVRLLLSWHSDPPQANCQDGAALIKAAGEGRHDVVLFLLSHQVNPPRADCQDGAALISAIAQKHITTIRLLLSWPINAPKANMRDNVALLHACLLEDHGGVGETKASDVIKLLLEWPVDAPRADCADGSAVLCSCKAIKEGLCVPEDKRLEVLFGSKHPPKANCLDNRCLGECAHRGLDRSVSMLAKQPCDGAEIDYSHGMAFVRMCQGFANVVNKTLSVLTRDSESMALLSDALVQDLDRNLLGYYGLSETLLSGNQLSIDWLEVSPKACSLCCRGGEALYILAELVESTSMRIIDWIGPPLGERPPERTRMAPGKKFIDLILNFCGQLIGLADNPHQEVEIKYMIRGIKMPEGPMQIIRMDYGPKEFYFRDQPYTYDEFKVSMEEEKKSFEFVLGLIETRLNLGSLQAYKDYLRETKGIIVQS